MIFEWFILKIAQWQKMAIVQFFFFYLFLNKKITLFFVFFSLFVFQSIDKILKMDYNYYYTSYVYR